MSQVLREWYEADKYTPAELVRLQIPVSGRALERVISTLVDEEVDERDNGLEDELEAAECAAERASEDRDAIHDAATELIGLAESRGDVVVIDAADWESFKEAIRGRS